MPTSLAGAARGYTLTETGWLRRFAGVPRSDDRDVARTAAALELLSLRTQAGQLLTERAFYLQVRTDSELVSLAIEKDQLRALTERLREVFSRVPVPPAGTLPDMALEEPIAPIWRVGE